MSEFNEQEIVKTIVLSSDWEEVIMKIIEEEKLDPWDIDIVKLVDAFFKYLRTMKEFDFRIPARFILVAAILLRMKCEFTRAEPKQKEEKVPDINPNVPLLEMPIIRRPKKKITVTELVTALKKVMDFEERKRVKKLAVRKAVEVLLTEETEDIRKRMEKILMEIETKNIETFSQLVGEWTRENITRKFVPLLHLSNEGYVSCEQPEEFGEIFINQKKFTSQLSSSQPS